MTQINLPNLSVTGANLWSQVEDNDKAIRDVVNGNIDATNLADDAVTAAKLRDDASTDANRAVTTNHIRDEAVTTAKIADDAVTSAKVALTNENVVLDASPALGTNSVSNTEQTANQTSSLSAGTYLVMFSGIVSVAGGVSTTNVRLKQGSTTLQTITPKNPNARTDFPTSLLAVATLSTAGTFSVTIQAPSTDFGATILNGARLVAVRIA